MKTQMNNISYLDILSLTERKNMAFLTLKKKGISFDI